MRGTQLALLAVGVMTLACAPAHAHRELFTQDCQGQVHLMGGVVSIGGPGAPDGDGMWSHIVRTLKARLACKCGADMNPDEFLRKFSVAHALLNLMGLSPDTTVTRTSQVQSDANSSSSQRAMWTSVLESL
jgi:hypothetical protein